MSSKQPSNRPANPPKAAAGNVGRSVDEFRQRHDSTHIIPARIKAALSKLDGWEYEAEFLRGAGVANNQISRFRPLFEDYTLQVRREFASHGTRVRYIWCASKALRDQLASMVD